MINQYLILLGLGGFFLGLGIFLYRKMYLIALIFFILSLALATILFGGIILSIIAGSTVFYFYTTKFYNDLQQCDYQNRSLEEVKNDLSKLGGYLSRVTFFVIIFYIVLLIFFSIYPWSFCFYNLYNKLEISLFIPFREDKQTPKMLFKFFTS